MPIFPEGQGPAWDVLNATGMRKNNFNGGRIPNAGDDISADYERGSRWWTGSTWYVCESNIAGSAVWVVDDAAAVNSRVDGLVADVNEVKNPPYVPFQTRAQVQSSNLSGIDFIDIAGLRFRYDPAGTAISDATGRNFSAIPMMGIVCIEAYGARGFTFDELVAADGVGMAAAANANATAFQRANAFLVSIGGGTIFYDGRIYPCSDTMARGSNVRVEGVGTGRYMPQTGVDKDFKGTVFLAYGTGPKVHSFAGITSGELNGGWRPDPDNPGEYFRLWSAYNADAVGTTPATLRQFSVLILDHLHDGAGGWANVTALPWRGTNGVSDYLSTSAPIWGDDWDFGYVIKNTEYVRSWSMNVSGPWRQAAHGFFLTIYEGVLPYNRGEQNLVEHCQLEGRIGHIVRSIDVWKTTATSSTSVSIAWTNEHYWPSSGQFRGSNGSLYNYTSTAMDGANLVFNGVTPSPSGLAHIRHGSSGLANTCYRQCLTYDLRTPNGSTAQSNGIASSALEVSGFPLRGLKFDNGKHHARGRVIAHLHQTADQGMIGHQFEGGGFLIASPEAAAQSWGPQATYDTRGLRLVSSNGLSGDVDMRLFTPRNSLADEIQLSPRNDYSGNLLIRALRSGKNLIMAIISGGRWWVQTPEGNEAISVGETGIFEVKRTDGTVVVQAGSTGHVSFFSAAGVELFRVPSSGNPSIRNGAQLSFVGGIARVNYDSGQYFAVREGTSERLVVSGVAIRSGQDGVVEIGTGSNKFTRAHLSDGVFVNNVQVVSSRQAAIANAAGGTEVATINSILAAMRAHGLISS